MGPSRCDGQHLWSVLHRCSGWAEVLCERWTPLVVRKLLCGNKRFNDLYRGVPRMSTSLLVQRLEEFGVVRRDAIGKV